MKKFILFMMIIPISFINAQKIGELAPEKPPEEFPGNSWGVDIMFHESGFGLGTFYRFALTEDLRGFIDFSISESKDDQEVEYIDYWGRTYTAGKLNRVFFLPLFTGVQYRIFENVITDNLRPYINIAAGPTMVVTTPYELEFFNSFGKARAKFAVGGYFGFGANFGLSKTNLVGVNLRYYFVHMFDEGVENLRNKFRNDIGSFYLTINLGIMY